MLLIVVMNVVIMLYIRFKVFGFEYKMFGKGLECLFVVFFFFICDSNFFYLLINIFFNNVFIFDFVLVK